MSEEPYNNFATAEENLVALQEWLAEIDQKAPRSIDKWFATSVLRATHRAYGHLRSGRLTDTSYTAWACRNLLELHVIARFGVQSPANRKKFIDATAIDFEEQAKAFVALITADDEDPQVFVDQLKAIDTTKTSIGVADTRFFSVGQAAKEIRLDGQYCKLFKIFSKRVHPTPLSVMGEDREDTGISRDERAELFKRGCNYVFEIITDISTFAQSTLL